MRIKKIEIRGFKSFYKKTVIPLSTGLNMIIGPNGSGKSNVIDAIVFVLGGLSAKEMRADSFSSLLFAPPENSRLQKAKSARVTLHFDNTDRSIPIDMDTVSISREISEDGSSVYRINGKRTTRQEILNILAPAGIGKNAYFIVLQGKIFEMVSMNPRKRAELLKEIAGVSYFDEKVESAKAELAKADENIRQHAEKVRELEERLEKLKEEVEKAKKYEALSSRLERIESALIVRQRKLLQNRVEFLTREIEKEKEEKEKALAQSKEFDERIGKIRNELSTIDEQIEKIMKENTPFQEKFIEIKSRKNTFESELQLLSGRLNETQERINELESRKKMLENELMADEPRLNKFEKEINELTHTFGSMMEEKKKIMDLIAGSSIDELESKRKSLKEELSGKRKKLEYIESEIKKAEKEKIIAEQSRENMRSRLDEVDKLLSELGIPAERLSEIEEEIKTRKEKIREFNIQLKKLAQEKESLMKKIARINAQLERAGTNVADLLKSSLSGVYGKVEDLITVDAEYRKAMIAAGGGRLHYIVVEDDEVAEECIMILRQEKKRATFIPLNKIRAPELKSRLKDGMISRVLDVIEYDPVFDEVMRYVFGDTSIVRDVTTARKIFDHSTRLVTLDGDLFEKSGVITGGHLNIEREVNLKIELEKNEEALKSVEDEIERIETEKESIERKLSVFEEKVGMIRGILGKSGISVSSYISKMRAEIKRLSEIIQKNEQRLELLATKKNTLVEDITRIESKIEEIESEIENARESENMKKLEMLDSRISEISSLLQEKRIEAGKLAHTIKSMKEELSSINLQISTLHEETTRIKKRMQELATEIDAAKKELDSMTAEMEERNSKIRELNNKRRELSNILRELQIKKEETLEKYHSCNTAIAHNQGLLEETQKQLIYVERRYNELRIKEDIEELSTDDLEKEKRRIKRELAELGPVNQMAAKEYKELKEKHSNLLPKLDQLREERVTIFRTIVELEREKLKKFMETFNAIGNNFREIYKEIYGGEGSGKLVFENPEKPLESGVFLMCKPPGKRMQLVDGLSGGEKSVAAIALILAIQQYEPAPFYIFDEVDAFLDDKNLSGMIRVIKNMSRVSQFIMISHKKLSLKYADHLVGISQVGGVSRAISINPEAVLNEQG